MDFIKAKTYLKQLQKIDMLIKQKKLELKKIQSILNSGVTSINYTTEKVQTSTSAGASFERLVNKKIDLENEIHNEIDHLINKNHTIINQIQSLENSEQIAVLYKRYVQYKSLVKISQEMYYCLSYINRLHKLGLMEFEKKFLN